jgi:hypothetical protein
MFVAHDVACGVSFVTARPRLIDLLAGRGLASASQAAYDEGLAGTASGRLPGPAPLMRVRALQPSQSADRVTAGLRWEARGPSAGLFPVLDADVTLAPDGRVSSRLGLAGVYRSPFVDLTGSPGAAVTGRVADTTIRVLLHAIAGYLSGSGSGCPPGGCPASADAL